MARPLAQLACRGLKLPVVIEGRHFDALVERGLLGFSFFIIFFFHLLSSFFRSFGDHP
jgi:hypothetical protein